MATTTKTNKKSVKKTTKTTSKQVKVKKKTPTVAVKTETVVEKEIKPIEVEKVVVQEQPKKPFVNKEIVEQVKKDVKKQMNIPNLLTLFRIWAIPGIVLTFFFPTAFWAWLGVVLFALAGISDYLDGYLARHWNQLSRFGRVLDPIADKLLVGAMLLMLAYTARLGDWGIIPAVVILCREILVSGLREFLAEIKVGCPVTRLAKWKTACQMIALPMLMVAEPNFSGMYASAFYTLGQIALWGAAILTVMTGYDYWKSGRKYMDE